MQNARGWGEADKGPAAACRSPMLGSITPTGRRGNTRQAPHSTSIRVSSPAQPLLRSRSPGSQGFWSPEFAHFLTWSDHSQPPEAGRPRRGPAPSLGGLGTASMGADTRESFPPGSRKAPPEIPKELEKDTAF